MVRLVVVCNYATARAVWGHAPLENLGNLEAMKLLLIPFLGGNSASRRPDDMQFHFQKCPTFLLIAFRLFINLTSNTFANEACKTLF